MIIKNINYALKKEFELEPIVEEDLELVKSFVNIILSGNVGYSVPIYREPVKLSTAIKYSVDFLNTINKKYADSLTDVIDSGNLTFRKRENEDDVSKVVYNTKTKNKEIDLVVTGTIADSYSMSHEIVHFDTLDLNKITTNWEYTTEGYAMTMEALQRIYFRNYLYRIPEYKYNEISNLLGVLEKACILDFEINLMKLYMRKKYITENDIHLLLKDKSDDYINYACYDLKEISDRYEQKGELYLNYIYLQRYIIGYMISTHLLEKINEDKKNIDLFIELCDNCNKMEFVDTLKNLGLELEDEGYVILSGGSLKTLKKEYKKRISNL